MGIKLIERSVFNKLLADLDQFVNKTYHVEETFDLLLNKDHTVAPNSLTCDSKEPKQNRLILAQTMPKDAWDGVRLAQVKLQQQS